LTGQRSHPLTPVVSTWQLFLSASSPLLSAQASSDALAAQLNGERVGHFHFSDIVTALSYFNLHEQASSFLSLVLTAGPEADTLIPIFSFSGDCHLIMFFQLKQLSLPTGLLLFLFYSNLPLMLW
jgi:hypothetical protein